MRKRWICIGIVCALGMGVSGCADKQVDYGIGGGTEDTQELGQGGNGKISQFANEGRWEEEWMVTTNKKREETRTISVDTDLTVPKLEQMSVVEVEEASFDAKYKERIAKKLYDDGEIYYRDVAHLPEKELLEWYDYYVENELGDYDEHLDEKIAAYEKAVENPKQTYTSVEEFSVNEYAGTRDGAMYDLTFTERTNEHDPYCPVLHRTKEIAFVPKDVYQVCPDAYRERQDLSYYVWQRQVWGEATKKAWDQNACGLSEKEAKAAAERLIDSLNLEYSVYVSSLPLLWYGDFENETETMQIDGRKMAVNGYVFYYDYGIDGVSVIDFGEEESYLNAYVTKKKGKGEPNYSMKARMELYVTDRGVIEMRACNPVETVQVTGSVGLVPIDAVKNAMKEQLTSNIGSLHLIYPQEGDKGILLDRMELIYFRIGNKEQQGNYSYIPTWRLWNHQSLNDGRPPFFKNVILINAIDGSPIDLWDEI